MIVLRQAQRLAKKAEKILAAADANKEAAHNSAVATGAQPPIQPMKRNKRAHLRTGVVVWFRVCPSSIQAAR